MRKWPQAPAAIAPGSPRPEAGKPRNPARSRISSPLRYGDADARLGRRRQGLRPRSSGFQRRQSPRSAMAGAVGIDARLSRCADTARVRVTVIGNGVGVAQHRPTQRPHEIPLRRPCRHPRKRRGTASGWRSADRRCASGSSLAAEMARACSDLRIDLSRSRLPSSGNDALVTRAATHNADFLRPQSPVHRAETPRVRRGGYGGVVQS